MVEMSDMWIKWDCIKGVDENGEQIHINRPLMLLRQDGKEIQRSDSRSAKLTSMDHDSRDYQIVAYRYIVAPPKNEEKPEQQDNPKYDKTMVDKYDHTVKIVADVYTVLESFKVVCPALGHAAKKILNPGVRGHKSKMEDLIDIKHSVDRAIELEKAREYNG
jgi:hypothetical protein